MRPRHTPIPTPPPRQGWFGLARVRGESMEPALRPGEWLLVSYRRRPRPGDVVVARFPDGTLAVKRAVEARRTRTGGPGWWLLSDRPESGVDSRHRGPVPEREVYAVGLRIVHPVRRLLRPLRRRGGPAGTIPA